jgi:hypothetical protein
MLMKERMRTLSAGSFEVVDMRSFPKAIDTYSAGKISCA